MAEEAPKQVVPEIAKDIREKKVAIVVASWNESITSSMQKGAQEAFEAAGYSKEQILVHQVPGAFELPLGVQYAFEYLKVEGVVALGCLIKGETDHYHYIAQAASSQLGMLALKYNRPCGFGLLTVEDKAQAEARSVSGPTNKGYESAMAALSMLALRHTLREGPRKTRGSIGFGVGFAGTKEVEVKD